MTAPGAARHRLAAAVVGLVLLGGAITAPISAAATGETSTPRFEGEGPLSPPDGGGSLDAIRVSRMSAPDRYELGAAVALATRPSGAETVYVASGANFPDALSAGPAAVKSGGALLLVAPDYAPPTVLAALTRLNPRKVVVVGGEAAVARGVADALAAAAPRAVVGRLGGSDRYAISRAVVAQAFSRGPDPLFVATGANFPDALAAGAPAGILGVPVLLVNGSASATDPDTLRTITALDPVSISIIGGTGAVSTGVESTLSSSTVIRIAGPDRYAVSFALNERVLADYSTVYLATGSSFPDALVGGVLAGTRHNPLYVIPGTCVPRPVLAKFAATGTTEVVLLGGTASLSPAVESLTPCP